MSRSCELGSENIKANTYRLRSTGAGQFATDGKISVTCKSLDCPLGRFVEVDYKRIVGDDRADIERSLRSEAGKWGELQETISRFKLLNCPRVRDRFKQSA